MNEGDRFFHLLDHLAKYLTFRLKRKSDDSDSKKWIIEAYNLVQ